MQLEFRKPPLLTWRALLAALGFAVLSVLVIASRTTVDNAGSLIIALASLGMAFAYRLWRSKQSVPPLVLDEQKMTLPTGPESPVAVQVPLGEVLSLSVSGEAANGRIAVVTRRRLFVYPLRSLLMPEAAVMLLPAFRSRLAEQPGGDNLLAEMSARDRLTHELFEEKPRVTQTLIVLLVFAFIIELWTGGLNLIQQPPLDLIRLGANAPPLVRSGEWYRLFTANFLHANLIHLYVNCAGLFSLGSLLEPLLGRWRFLAIYLTTALGGAIASTLVAHSALSVGASTAVFGLLAAFAVIEWRFVGELPATLRQSRTWWIAIIAINSALSLLPFIDGAAHLGGAATGVVLALLLARRLRPQGSEWGVRIFTSVLVLAFAAGIVVAARDRRNNSDERLLAAYEDVSDPVMLNELAFGAAIDANASQVVLARAAQLVERALAEKPDEAAFIDTRATVAYRQKHFGEAVALERVAFASRVEATKADPTKVDPVIANQLARFFLAAKKSGEAKGDTPEVKASAEGIDVSLDFVAPPKAGELLLVVQRGDAIVGLLQLFVAADRAKQVVSVGDKEQVPDETTLTPAFFTEGPSGISHFYEMPSEVAGYP